MKNTILFYLILPFISFGQSVDFGVELQQNNNLVKKWLLTDELSDFNRAFSVLDNNQDTINVYFNTFSMANNFEIPIYFRFNFKKRSFIDFKLSNTTHTLLMQGVSNYSNDFFTTNFGTYDDFVLQAQADGFSNVNQSDYDNYINGAKSFYQNKVSAVEEFKVLSLTANYGFRFLPHRSIKPYLTAGFTVKGKYRKFSYQHLDFTSNNVFDLSKVNEGVNKFAETTLYLNFGYGFEFYRFRLGIYYQGGFAFQFTNTQTNSVVVDVNPFTPFERIHSYGLTVSANLLSTPIGKRVTYDDSAEDDLVLSNIKKKTYKWEFGLKFNRRGFNDMSSFYADPSNRLSLLSKDSILFNNNGTIMSAEKIEMTTLGDLKRILWSGEFELTATRNFGKRFSLNFSLGLSNLSTDIATTEFTATILHGDSISAPTYAYSNNEPRIKSGVYRSSYSLVNTTTSVSYKLFNRDLFSLSLIMGWGNTVLAKRVTSYNNYPEGVNELHIYNTIDIHNYNMKGSGLYAFTGNMQIDPNTSPDSFTSKFGNQPIDENWQSPKKLRGSFPTVRFGFELGLDKFTLGFTTERSTTYMDGFILNTYSSVYFSLGYKFIRR